MTEPHFLNNIETIISVSESVLVINGNNQEVEAAPFQGSVG